MSAEAHTSLKPVNKYCMLGNTSLEMSGSEQFSDNDSRMFPIELGLVTLERSALSFPHQVKWSLYKYGHVSSIVSVIERAKS